MRPMFEQSPEKILERGLHSLSLACEVLEKQNKELESKVVVLEQQLSKLREQLLTQPTS